MRHDVFAAEDTRRRAEGLAFRASLAGTVASVCSTSSVDADAGSICSSVPAHSSDADYSSLSEASLAGSEGARATRARAQHAAEVDLFRNARLATTPRCDMTTVVFTHDLSGVDTLHSPRDFFAEQDTLMMYVRPKIIILHYVQI